jgi:predicted DNA-binding transcriptional regulator AlpA
MIDNRLLTQNEAAKFLNISPRTLENWRRKGTGPRYVSYSNRCLRYSESDLADWLAARAHCRSGGSPNEEQQS